MGRPPRQPDAPRPPRTIRRYRWPPRTGLHGIYKDKSALRLRATWQNVLSCLQYLEIYEKADLRGVPSPLLPDDPLSWVVGYALEKMLERLRVSGRLPAPPSERHTLYMDIYDRIPGAFDLRTPPDGTPPLPDQPTLPDPLLVTAKMELEDDLTRPMEPWAGCVRVSPEAVEDYLRQSEERPPPWADAWKHPEIDPLRIQALRVALAEIPRETWHSEAPLRRSLELEALWSHSSKLT